MLQGVYMFKYLFMGFELLFFYGISIYFRLFNAKSGHMLQLVYLCRYLFNPFSGFGLFVFLSLLIRNTWSGCLVVDSVVFVLGLVEHACVLQTGTERDIM